MNYLPLNEISYDGITLSSLTEIFERSINDHERPVYNGFPSNNVYRGRRVDLEKSDLNTTSCIWYPDWSKIEKSKYRLNRCSDKGEYFFYCSNSLECVVKESKLKNGDQLLIGKFDVINNMRIRSALVSLNRLKNSNDLQGFRKLQDYKFSNKKDQDIDDFISSFYTKDIDDEEDYKPSIAFTKILMKNNNHKCIIYPSVASDFDFLNFGVKPEFVDSNFICKEVFLFNVKIDDNFIELTPYMCGLVIPNGEPKTSPISWKVCSEEERETSRFSTNSKLYYND